MIRMQLVACLVKGALSRILNSYPNKDIDIEQKGHIITIEITEVKRQK